MSGGSCRGDCRTRRRRRNRNGGDRRRSTVSDHAGGRIGRGAASVTCARARRIGKDPRAGSAPYKGNSARRRRADVLPGVRHRRTPRTQEDAMKTEVLILTARYAVHEETTLTAVALGE